MAEWIHNFLILAATVKTRRRADTVCCYKHSDTHTRMFNNYKTQTIYRSDLFRSGTNYNI